MSRLAGLVCAVVLLIPVAKPQNEKFLKYKPVDAYEIRPGILMMPRYSDDGQVCEIGLERRHYSPEMIRLDPGLSREEIDQIVDELVPVDERGPHSKDFTGRDMDFFTGVGGTTDIEYENVSIQISFGKLPAAKHREVALNNVAATIRWKNRPCH